jgi:hypothetical protein
VKIEMKVSPSTSEHDAWNLHYTCFWFADVDGVVVAAAPAS